MKPDIDTLLASFQGQFEPGSIVEQSIRTAYDQVHKGNILVAQSILKYLAVPESLKNQILGNQAVVQSQPNPHFSDTPLQIVTPTNPTPPQEPPAPVPKTTPDIPQKPSNIDLHTNQTPTMPAVWDAIFVSPTNNTVAGMPTLTNTKQTLPVPKKPVIITENKSSTIGTQTSNLSVSSTKTTGTAAYSIPRKAPTTTDTPTAQTTPALEQPRSLDVVWEAFAKQNIEQNTPITPGEVITNALTATVSNPAGTTVAPSGLFTENLSTQTSTTSPADPHLAPPGKRADAFDALLARARTTNATVASGKIAPDAQIPLIHTYAEPTPGRERTMVSTADTARAEKLFSQAQTYLEKALADGSPEMIQSAQRAVANLYARYPFYREHKPEHIQKLDILLKQESPQTETPVRIDTGITSNPSIYRIPPKQPATNNSTTKPTNPAIQKLTLAGTDVHVGMSITGKSGAKYLLESIERTDGLHTLVFTSNGKTFRVSSSAIESALKNPNTEPDVFFTKYQIE